MRFGTFSATRSLVRDLDRLIATQIAIGTSAFDLEAVMATVVDEARELTHADAAVIELPDGDDMVYRAASGKARPHTGIRVPRATSISGLAVATGEVLVSADTRLDPRVNREICEKVGARSLVVVPLPHDGRPIGVLKVYSGRPDAFEDGHERILGSLANLVGTALVRAELMARLEEQAVTDELTGLPNRRAWYARLDEAIARAGRSRAPLSVVVLDLDDFKEVNDRHGHAAGDALLREASSRWSIVVREVDLLARLGGDEFGVVAEWADAHAAGEIVRRLAAANAHPASAGIATWDGRESADELVSRADSAMYARKRRVA